MVRQQSDPGRGDVIVGCWRTGAGWQQGPGLRGAGNSGLSTDAVLGAASGKKIHLIFDKVCAYCVFIHGARVGLRWRSGPCRLSRQCCIRAACPSGAIAPYGGVGSPATHPCRRDCLSGLRRGQWPAAPTTRMTRPFRREMVQTDQHLDQHLGPPMKYLASHRAFYCGRFYLFPPPFP